MSDSYFRLTYAYLCLYKFMPNYQYKKLIQIDIKDNHWKLLISVRVANLNIYKFLGTWVAQSAMHLPLAQVLIPESWNRAPGQAPSSAGSLLLPPPLPLSIARALSLSFSQNK